MGSTWVLLAPRWAPCWPHEPCYLGSWCCQPHQMGQHAKPKVDMDGWIDGWMDSISSQFVPLFVLWLLWENVPQLEIQNLNYFHDYYEKHPLLSSSSSFSSSSLPISSPDPPPTTHTGRRPLNFWFIILSGIWKQQWLSIENNSYQFISMYKNMHIFIPQCITL